MVNKIALELITAESKFRSLEPEWNTLLQDSRANNIFLTWEWISSWWDVFGKDRHLWILVARDSTSNRTLGLAPLNLGLNKLTKRFPSTYRELSFIGANNASPDHLDFIIRNGYEAIVAPVIADYMKSHADWDILQLDGLVSNSPMIPYFTEQVPAWGKYIYPEKIAIIRLPESWEVFRSQINKKLRKNIERYARNLESDYPGKVQRIQVTHENDLAPALLTVFQLSGQVKESQGKLYSLKESELIEFHRKVALKFRQKQWLRLYNICVEGKTVAASYSFSYNNILSYYQSGYDLDWKHYGAGQQIRAYSILEAINEGVKEFDFLRGEHAYKSEWANEKKTDLYLRAGCSLKGRSLVALQALMMFFSKLRTKEQD